jgi:superfamily II RNA helicase
MYTNKPQTRTHVSSSYVTADDVQYTLRDDLPADGELAHPLIRGLRRGIGLYVSGLPSAYHRVVQSFAQRGRLGVVFSDELLAYGVNMPFRTTVFYGDPGRNWLTPLMHQQMAGRAGRRGLDRRGHLVYAGFSPDRLRGLLRGELPAVKGRFPLYPTIPLQMFMNEKWEVTGKPLTREKMTQICATPLAEFLKGKSPVLF